MKTPALFLVLLLASATQAPRTETKLEPVDGPRSLAAYQRLKAYTGDWEGHSTKGWTGRERISDIAGGSTLMMQSTFSAHPADNEGMATMIHMDRDRLLLTHYCVAKNQPRLALTAASSDLNLLEFTFLDGGNIADRNAGHMDRVVITLQGADKFTSRWTWYAKGQEQWLEEIVNTRVQPR